MEAEYRERFYVCSLVIKSGDKFDMKLRDGIRIGNGMVICNCNRVSECMAMLALEYRLC